MSLRIYLEITSMVIGWCFRV